MAWSTVVGTGSGSPVITVTVSSIDPSYQVEIALDVLARPQYHLIGELDEARQNHLEVVRAV